MKKLVLVVAWLIVANTTITTTFLAQHHLGNVQISQAFATVQPVVAVPSYEKYAALPRVTANLATVMESGDARPVILSKFLGSYGSPLAKHADKLIQVSDKYGLDYRLLAAIAMQESGGGKKIPEGSFNAWGWAIYENSTKRFSSWEEAIEVVGKGIKNNYIDRGLKTPEKIMTRYAPVSLANGGSWAKGVNYFLEALQ